MRYNGSLAFWPMSDKIYFLWCFLSPSAIHLISLKLLLACIYLELLRQALLFWGTNLSSVVITSAIAKAAITQMISSMSMDHAQEIVEVNKLTPQKVRKQWIKHFTLPLFFKFSGIVSLQIFVLCAFFLKNIFCK